MPVAEQAELLLSINDKLLSYSQRGIKKAHSFVHFSREDKTFASTEGSLIHQTLYRCYSGFSCTAVVNGDAQSRSYERPPLNTGYEHIALATWVRTLEGRRERLPYGYTCRRQPDCLALAQKAERLARFPLLTIYRGAPFP